MNHKYTDIVRTGVYTQGEGQDSAVIGYGGCCCYSDFKIPCTSVYSIKKMIIKLKV